MSAHADAIVACARGWLGTRFHHQGRLKKTREHAGGVDCLGLLVGVAKELKLQDVNGLPLSLHDVFTYPHLPDVEKLQQSLCNCLELISIDQMCVGDVALIRISERPQHLAILTDFNNGPGVIHAYAPAKKVVERALDAWWKERIYRAYRIAKQG